ncbi:hypothetical protein [Amycolatopsis sp. 195334CR]|uniref:hypothetical protein n=1 Tax=Amycolatopsis sp. 195334CR TaxID=2814588 RepID=UPI001A8EBD57|nr:hypothetical protein [Amycolatopsis sp. 195334CR]MBN6042022.1 hypothetical protein [Amycolatopsis sp. 195334CR]
MGRRATTSRLADGTGELTTALTTVTFFQGAVQHADEKVRTLIAAQSMITALTTAQAGLLLSRGHSPAVQVLAFALLGAFGIGYALSGFHLIQALRPRTKAPSPLNRFAFPSVAAGNAQIAEVPLRAQCEQAHELARLLADLAMIKHRHVRRALSGTAAMFTSGLALLAMIAVS